VPSLPKHLRPRWRYLGVELAADPDAGIDRDGFSRALDASARRLLGDPGAADAALAVYRFRWRDGRGGAVVRARREAVAAARAAVACVRAVDGRPVGVRVRGVAGTVRACSERYLPAADPESRQESVAFAAADRSAVLRGDDCDVRTDPGFVGATRLDLDHDH